MTRPYANGKIDKLLANEVGASVWIDVKSTSPQASVRKEAPFQLDGAHKNYLSCYVLL